GSEAYSCGRPDRSSKLRFMARALIWWRWLTARGSPAHPDGRRVSVTRAGLFAAHKNAGQQPPVSDIKGHGISSIMAHLKKEPAARRVEFSVIPLTRSHKAACSASSAAIS